MLKVALLFGFRQRWNYGFGITHLTFITALCKRYYFYFHSVGEGYFPGDSVVKNPPANEEDVSWIPGSRRSLGVGNGNPLQYSCLGNPMDRGTWRATVHGIEELDMTEHAMPCHTIQ